MYCNKISVNKLTSLLIAYGIDTVVVCPGSRNAVMVHNFNESPSIKCYSVTDERSAAFCAMGMALATNKPVAVCVTSGSALLNTLPAVAEAYYQQIPLLVISADRPAAWINQGDGQTLPQRGALGCFVSKSIELPEIKDDTEDWFCNRLINEALIALFSAKKPIHINVPISEPLFAFTTSQLQNERKITYHQRESLALLPEEVAQKIERARLPVLVIGQMTDCSKELCQAVEHLHKENKLLVIPELLSNFYGAERAETIERNGTQAIDSADLAIYIGGTLVGKNIKKGFRTSRVETIRISDSGETEDTFCNTTHIVNMHNNAALSSLCALLENSQEKPEVKKAKDLLTHNHYKASQAAQSASLKSRNAVQALCEKINMLDENSLTLHLANSSAVRLAARYLRSGQHKVYCNRGVNGIEGSLSTAVGFSICDKRTAICIIGDLSFFYDSNALWNNNLHNNFKVLLLNNGGGRIFHKLPGLQESGALKDYISASHSAKARGIASAYGLEYLCAASSDSLDEAMEQFLSKSERPVLLEIITNE